MSAGFGDGMVLGMLDSGLCCGGLVCAGAHHVDLCVSLNGDYVFYTDARRIARKYVLNFIDGNL